MKKLKRKARPVRVATRDHGLIHPVAGARLCYLIKGRGVDCRRYIHIGFFCVLTVFIETCDYLPDGVRKLQGSAFRIWSAAGSLGPSRAAFENRVPHRTRTVMGALTCMLVVEAKTGILHATTPSCYGERKSES